MYLLSLEAVHTLIGQYHLRKCARQLLWTLTRDSKLAMEASWACSKSSCHCLRKLGQAQLQGISNFIINILFFYVCCILHFRGFGDMESTPMGCVDDLPTILGIFKSCPKSRSVNNSLQQLDLIQTV